MRLDVYSAQAAAGRLWRGDAVADNFWFGYLDHAVPEQAVSLTMPVLRDPYSWPGGLHPIFEMNLPEGGLKERLSLLLRKTLPRFDDLALLAVVGASQIGRLRYAEADTPLSEVPEQSVQALLAYDGAEDLFEDLLQRYAVYSGVSGVQPKVLLRDAVPLQERLTYRGATHIVKAWHADDYPELAANEYFCLQAAQQAGLPVASHQLSANGKLLVVERFDLDGQGGYLGFEDFCVLNGLQAAERYQGSYERIARRIREFVSPSAQRAALEQFFHTLALCCAIQNGDAHYKNFGVLYATPESTVTLAPAYDLVCTTPYIRNDCLALTLAGSKRFPNRKTLVAFGRQHCGLSEQRVRAILEQTAAGLHTSLPALQAYGRARPGFAAPGKAMARAWEEGMRRLLENS